MRNPKGNGGVHQKKGKYYARWKISGKDAYGPARDTWDQADIDRVELNPRREPEKRPKNREIPTFDKHCFDMLGGAYGQTAIAKSTYGTQENNRVKWIHPADLAKLKVNRITRVDVVQWIETLKGEPATKARIVATASRLMTLAIDLGYRKDNPFGRLGNYLPKVEERENRILSESEAQCLVELGWVQWIDAVIIFALRTGLRRGEIARMQWGHLRGAMLHIPKTKTHRARTVPLAPDTLTLLRSIPKRHVNFVFTTSEGEPLKLNTITQAFRRRKAELGLPMETRLQDMRGTFGSMLLEQGADLRAVMELGGWSKPETLLKAYARSNAGRKEGAVVSLSDRLKKPLEVREETA